MFRKLAFSNVKKSIRDYAIYFITLVFGVCLFYVFNSMGSQEKMLKLSESSHQIIQMLIAVMGYVSIFISFILGFLILYANTFLIKRRKKELGLYMVLGMDKKKISRMLLYETLLIGVFALVVGLVIGVFASQGLAVVTAKLMEVELKQFVFVFSWEAAIKSLMYFGIIFFIVIVFNAVAISKYKLIDLLTAGRKNEKDRTPQVWISVVLFFVAVIMIGIAYKFLFDMKSSMNLMDLAKTLITGAIGTFLFFYSLSGFMLKLVKTSKKVYFRGLNMFILRQINSKLSTTFVSMTIISLMLLIAITTMAAGLAFSKVMTENKEKSMPCDASAYYQIQEPKLSSKIDQYIEKKNTITEYKVAGFNYEYLLTQAKELTDPSFKGVMISSVSIVSLSDYNKEMKFENRNPITLSENSCAIVTTITQMNDIYQKLVDRKTTLKFGTHDLLPINPIIDRSLANEFGNGTVGTIIVPDKVLSDVKAEKSGLWMNFQYKDATEKIDDKVRDLLRIKGNENYQVVTKISSKTASVGVRVVTSFFILYVGIIFLISCAAILALQQLSESSDNVMRYQLLRKLGVEDRMMKRAMFVQMGIYFMVPLIVAMIHSCVSIKFTTEVFSMLGETGLGSNIIMVGGFITIIYGGYFIATYLGGKSIIREK